MDSDEVVNAIFHYKKRLEKPASEEKTCYYISKLKHLPVTIEHLHATGVGITVNSLRKTDGIIGEKARSLVRKWKLMVEQEDKASRKYNSDQDSYQVEDVDDTSPQRLSEGSRNGHHSESEEVSANVHKQSKSRSCNPKYQSNLPESSSYDSEIKNYDTYEHYRHDMDKYSCSYDESAGTDEEKEDEMEIDFSKCENESSDEAVEGKPLVIEKKSHKHKKTAKHSDASKHRSKISEPKPVKRSTDSPKAKSVKCKSDVGSRIVHENHEIRREKTKKAKKSKDKSSSKLLEDVSTSSFADALGSTDSLSSTPKKASKPKKNKKVEPILESKELQVPELVNNICIPLPKIDPDYKPFHYPVLETVTKNKARLPSDEEALNMLITTKRARTKVYSGIKNYGWSTVPSLYDICVKILQDNITALEYTGGVPFDILRPVLEKASPDQLEVLEYYNPYLVEDTDPLWERHCAKFVRNKMRQELESWREMYFRCKDEDEAKLKLLKENYLQSRAQALPVRQTKLAYVDTFAKPPRSIARKQEKYGTYDAGRPRPVSNDSASSSSFIAPCKVPPPSKAMQAPKKPKLAPLMQKTLKFMKNRFKK